MACEHLIAISVLGIGFADIILALMRSIYALYSRKKSIAAYEHLIAISVLGIGFAGIILALMR